MGRCLGSDLSNASIVCSVDEWRASSPSGHSSSGGDNHPAYILILYSNLIIVYLKHRLILFHFPIFFKYVALFNIESSQVSKKKKIIRAGSTTGRRGDSGVKSSFGKKSASCDAN